MVLTQHALDRYMQRSGCRRVVKSLNRIERLAAKAIPIGKTQFYAEGWILRMVGGEIVTVHRPNRSQMRKIYKAMNTGSQKTTT